MHKDVDPKPIRMITPSQGPMEHLDEFLQRKLKPYADNLEHVIKDTKET